MEVPDGFDIIEEEDGYTYGDERVDIEVVVLLLVVALMGVVVEIAVAGSDVEDDAEENVLVGKGKREG